MDGHYPKVEEQKPPWWNKNMSPEEAKRKIVELKKKPEFGRNVLPPKKEPASYSYSSSSDEDEDDRTSEGSFSPPESGKVITKGKRPLEVAKPGRDKRTSTKDSGG